MSEGKRRRCQFCWAMVPWKESTVITSSKTGREKWIEALGEGFRNQLEKVGTRRAYICRSHFPSGEVHGRRSVYSLPRLAADGDVADTSNLDFSEGDNGFEIIEDSRVADNEESFVLLNTDGEEDGDPLLITFPYRFLPTQIT